MKKIFSKTHKLYIRTFLAAAIILLGICGIIYSVNAYNQTFKVGSVIVKEREIGFDESIIIDFSQKMLPTWKEMRIEVYPARNFSQQWDFDNKRLKITPADFWEPEQTYFIAISGGKSVLLKTVDARFEFQTKKIPNLETLYPLEGEKDVLVDKEYPIFAAFDDSLKDFNLKLTLSPSVKLEYFLDEESKRVRLIPGEKLAEGKKYNLDVFIKYKKEPTNKYRKIGSTYFETRNAKIAPELWAKEPVVRLAQAKQSTEPRIMEGKYIDVNLKEQVVVMFENGKPQEAFQISSGKRGMETPSGSFSIHNKFPRVWSKKYGLFMPYWMALVGSGEFGFHELPEWPGGYKEGANHLGIPVSHGCIRLGVGPARMLYDWAEIGTKVEIHY